MIIEGTARGPKLSQTVDVRGIIEGTARGPKLSQTVDVRGIMIIEGTARGPKLSQTVDVRGIIEVTARGLVLQRVDGYLVEGRVDQLPEYLIGNRVPDISPVDLVIHDFLLVERRRHRGESKTMIRKTFGVCMCVCVCVSPAYHHLILHRFL